MDFNTLEGKTLAKIDVGDDEIIFEAATGERYRMWHSQDCCESVIIESVTGDVNDLISTPILLAEEAQSQDDPPDVTKKETYAYDSQTWTFYKLRTIKGSVDIRWYGSSNGYYSEGVDFEQIT